MNRRRPPRRDPVRICADDAPLTPEEQAAYDRQGELIAMELSWENALRASGHPVPAAMDGVRWGNGDSSREESTRDREDG
ncbi:hypothetical protein ABZ234_25025 [Nocardiopsis sp. NPDC006198]|uniref:hypothetical protein n=1 Tax=Nocardiopsis sp. NPDC006198 TaxID=3154472 RepID=UPI0033A6FA40